MAIELVLEEVTNEELPSVAMDTLRTVGRLFLVFFKDLKLFSCCHRNKTKLSHRLPCVIFVRVCWVTV